MTDKRRLTTQWADGLEPHHRCAEPGGYACTCGADQRNEVSRLNDRIAKLEKVAKAARDYVGYAHLPMNLRSQSPAPGFFVPS